MKITVEKPRSVFEDLIEGDTFWPDDDGWYDEDEIFMVIAPDYNLGEGFSHYGYALSLKTGEIYAFSKDDKVVKYDLNITAKPIG